MFPFSIRWVATGAAQVSGEEGGSRGPWRDSHGVSVVPFRPMSADLSDWDLSGPGPHAFVIDENVQPFETVSGIRALRELSGSFLSEGAYFVTVSDFLRDDRVWEDMESSTTTETVPTDPWTGDYTLWVGQPLKRAAWRLLALVARDIDKAQASGQVWSRRIETATRELHNAESGRFFINLDSRIPADLRLANEREFRVTLKNVYRILRQPFPEELKRPLRESEAADIDPTRDTQTESGSYWLVFHDPSGDNRIPQSLEGSTSTLSGGIWDLEAFRITWNEDAVTFSISVSSVAEMTAGLGGPESLVLDIYIDMNNRPGAGVRSLLSGRKALIEPRDAWEFALTFSGRDGKLFKAGLQGQMRAVENLRPLFHPYTRTVSVSVPFDKVSYVAGNYLKGKMLSGRCAMWHQ